MRIGIDFDNTIICYDDVFSYLAKSWNLLPTDFQGSKRAIRDAIWKAHDDLAWQKLQGKAYGEFIHHAKPFAGCKEFLTECQKHPQIELFIVSHKTEFGHFDEKKISLRDASRLWLREHGLLDFIKEKNVYFETTRDEKIARIQSLQCTHFIDDLPEVLTSPLFPNIKRFLFQPDLNEISHEHQLQPYVHWNDISHAIFTN